MFFDHRNSNHHRETDIVTVLLDGSVREENCALPPEDTLISSYHQPPEVQLSEKAQRYLSAKESLIEEANLAKSKAAVEAARCPTPDVLSGGTIPTANGPVAQIRSVSLTRWINLSGGGDRDRDKSKVRSTINPMTVCHFSCNPLLTLFAFLMSFA
jgi:hypothetical protein